jgi:indole-3-glycerol phosphate synthase
MILDRIMARKRVEVAERRLAVPLAELRARGSGRVPPLDFAAALRCQGVSLIAEVKRASPSRGLLCLGFDPEELAAIFRANGAAAISVLTDRHFFQGDLDSLSSIRQAVGPTVPLLRKDFLFDPYQVYEAWAYGADALLLIVAVLSDEELADLLNLTYELGMAALVEVHDEEEVERALRVQPQVVGINNRNLHDFSVDLSTFGRLRDLLPGGVVAVAESGVRSGDDVRRLAAMGADGVLVGEALVSALDVAATVREMVMAGGR